MITSWKKDAFQSLSRDSVCSNDTTGEGDPDPYCVSIPQSGFCVLKHHILLALLFIVSRFNPSVGILCAQTCARQSSRSPVWTFQSLSRDSVCSNAGFYRREGERIGCFNPSVGILCAQTASRSPPPTSPASFNPSVGILCAQTEGVVIEHADAIVFQSLSRDSVCSNGRTQKGVGGDDRRFNPSVGILCAQTLCQYPPQRLQWRFNPSVGILCAQTAKYGYPHTSYSVFQSLSRDSVCSNPS